MKQFTLLILMLWSGFVASEQVQDPTKPKQIYIATQQSSVDEDTQQSGVLRLQGVVNKKGHKLAIISGELYNKGDKVDGYQIREIHNNYVVMVGSGTQKRLYVYE